MCEYSNENPIISVVVACYNQAEYIADALDSLLNQTYVSWEGIIINDGSSDNTEEVALEYVNKDGRFRYFSKENGGVSSARNYGIKCSLGVFILPLDADDLLAPTYIEKVLDVFRDIPQTRLVYSQWRYFGLTTETVPISYQGYAKLLQGNTIFCSAVFRKIDCLNIGGYDEKMLWGFEDWEFYIRLLDEASLVYQIQEPLFAYRIKEKSRNVDANKIGRLETIHNYIYLKHIDTYTSYFGCPIDVLRCMLNYRQEMEKYKSKYKNEWFRLYFRKLKKAIKGR